jgi:hypothetical protein
LPNRFLSRHLVAASSSHFFVSRLVTLAVPLLQSVLLRLPPRKYPSKLPSCTCSLRSLFLLGWSLLSHLLVPAPRRLSCAILSISGLFSRPLYCEHLLAVEFPLLTIASLARSFSIAFSLTPVTFLCRGYRSSYFRLVQSSTEATSHET